MGGRKEARLAEAQDKIAIKEEHDYLLNFLDLVPILFFFFSLLFFQE